jgi:hypothetical protein
MPFFSSLYQYSWKKPRRRSGTKRSGMGWRLEALAMMARRHVLHAQAQRTTSLAFRRRKISRSRSVDGDDAHESSSIVRFFYANTFARF